jgi:hypothetical protein
MQGVVPAGTASSSASTTGPIAAGAAGGVIFLLVIIVFVLFIIARRRSQKVCFLLIHLSFKKVRDSHTHVVETSSSNFRLC